MRWLRYSINIIATLALGLLLARWISVIPYEFSPLPSTIAAIMRLFGADPIDHAEDIETIGLLVIIAGSIAAMAVVVTIADFAWRRLFKTPS